MKKTALIFFTMILSFATSAQNKFTNEVFTSQAGDSLLYRELIPEKLDSNIKYPLVLFLHGAGERGNDNEAQLRHGANMFTNPVNRSKYPAFVLFPQCPVESYWAPINRDREKDEDFFPFNGEISPTLQAVKKLLDKVVTKYPIDKNRIYIMGLSMGGMGTFDMVCRYPDLFAAAIPICGGINTERLEQIDTSTNFRIYHGDADSVVPVKFSRDAYIVLKEKKVNVEYIEFPSINHDSWTPAFNMPDFMEWLFSQSK